MPLVSHLLSHLGTTQRGKCQVLTPVLSLGSMGGAVPRLRSEASRGEGAWRGSPGGDTVDITGEQHTLGTIFSERFCFSVPPYRRQYAWKVEHAADLLVAVTESLGADDSCVRLVQELAAVKAPAL
jgi:hypothetical protein